MTPHSIRLRLSQLRIFSFTSFSSLGILICRQVFCEGNGRSNLTHLCLAHPAHAISNIEIEWEETVGGWYTDRGWRVG